ncbi:hypothetical protein L1887_23672 [Cichorium endivia]|nr:hypothetical protein L1887_23672 [Cichorium endivia]
MSRGEEENEVDRRLNLVRRKRHQAGSTQDICLASISCDEEATSLRRATLTASFGVGHPPKAIASLSNSGRGEELEVEEMVEHEYVLNKKDDLEREIVLLTEKVAV